MRRVLGGVVAIVISSAASAQAPMAGQSPAAMDATVPREARLPLGTTIILVMNAQLNSAENRVGDAIALTVVDDVRIDGEIVIPRGTPAMGEVIWRTGRGAFGRSGKMDIAMRYVELNGVRLPIEGVFRQTGGTPTAAIIASGVLGVAITGSSATIPAGQRIVARAAYAVPFMIPGGQIAPSYDAAAALAAVQPTQVQRREDRR
jgi:hypothetical protein